MFRSNIDGTLDCVTAIEKTQQKKQTESEEAEAEPARHSDEVENSATCTGETETATFSAKTDRNGVSASQASQIESEGSEVEMTWEEIEDEWFEHGSDFMIF
ncbi:MAG: hypothetical protein JOZ78_25890 [Chroococcidiopsidaceae cyanobacterium CP_BM_ER_R8_30]|nr:hypothetical protein [Chroococcidiopsidaceae cyanobacterium CP_BM_ER_R8_30]